MAEIHRVRELLCKKVNYAEENPWKDELPTHSKQQAVAECFRAKKATLSNYMAGNNCGYDMKPRSRYKSRQETVPWEPYRFEDQRTYDRAKHKGKGDFTLCTKGNEAENSWKGTKGVSGADR